MAEKCNSTLSNELSVRRLNKKKNLIVTMFFIIHHNILKLY